MSLEYLSQAVAQHTKNIHDNLESLVSDFGLSGDGREASRRYLLQDSYCDFIK